MAGLRELTCGGWKRRELSTIIESTLGAGLTVCVLECRIGEDAS